MADYTVHAGELRTRITFQEPTVTADASGAQVASWAAIAATPTVWARWVNAHGQEAVSNEALKSSQRATVTVRYRSDLRESWRIQRLSDSSYWQILSIDHVQGRGRWTEMIVERVKGTV